MMLNTDSPTGSANWNFDHSYSRLPSLFFAERQPEPVRAPRIVIFNHALAEALGIAQGAFQQEEALSFLAGNQMVAEAHPIAQAYAGHQYGHFTMLGDGRAILLGEHITPTGERFDIQLKGSGQTPFSRRGDGRAALGPMLREYVISEAMAAFGIPTTRSLAVVTTGEPVMREMALPGAILTRVAASHIRVGTFEYASAWGKPEDLKVLADYTLRRHYPDSVNAENPYLALLQGVMARQASLIAKWQLVGFVHGVMNTDNMTLSGETIDYGPCAFMDRYDPATVFSSIDTYGRYAYGNQPRIAHWNLARLTEALLPLLHDDPDEALTLGKEALAQFPDLFHQAWQSGMRVKLGLRIEEPEDVALFEDLLSLMQQHEADYTQTFRALSDETDATSALFLTEEFGRWQARWQDRISRQGESMEQARELMRRHNPAVIPRNHQVEAALKAAVEVGDMSPFHRLLDVLKNPYDVLPEHHAYTLPPEPTGTTYKTFCGT
jgi:uncharacterized protein YdiU (UPF0061 family)